MYKYIYTSSIPFLILDDFVRTFILPGNLRGHKAHIQYEFSLERLPPSGQDQTLRLSAKFPLQLDH